MKTNQSHTQSRFRIWHWVASKKGKWITLAIWIVIVGLLNSLVPSINKYENNNAANLRDASPSVQADQVEAREFPSNAGIPALIVWQRQGGLSEGDFQYFQQLTRHLKNQPLPNQTFIPPFDQTPIAALKAQASKDQSTFVLPVFFDTSADAAHLKTSIEQLKKEVATDLPNDPFSAKQAAMKSSLSAHITGPVGIVVDAADLFVNADVSLLLATVLLVLILLLLIYRSPILAFIPLIAVGFAYGTVGPLLSLMAKHGWITVDGESISIMTVLLFGAGTDYCLFLVARFRHLLGEETNKTTALLRSISSTAGAIAMSGFTVMIALLALLLAHYGSYHRFAIPFSLAILVMGMASLTLVPALLAIFGRASFFPFIPRTAEMQRQRTSRRTANRAQASAPNKFGHTIGAFVCRKPLTIVVVTVILLGGFAASASQIKITYDLLASFPKTMDSRQGSTILAKEFSPGTLAPVKIIIDTKGRSVPLAAKLSALPFVEQVAKPQLGAKNPQIMDYDVQLKLNPYSIEAMKLIPELRSATMQALSKAGVATPASSMWIQGQTATQYDTWQATNRDMRVVIPIVIIFIAVLLLLYLRSIVAMLYLIATVLLSYFSALGLGWLIIHDLLGIDAIAGAIPLYSFVFLVALGEDYNIFMISSIWQKRKTMPLLKAIQEGVGETSSVITSAGLILAGTFAVLATLPIQILFQFGLITAIGVLLDTFIVRPFLVPAITALLGRRAFWPGNSNVGGDV